MFYSLIVLYMVLPSVSAGVLTKPCLMIKDLSKEKSRWRCLVDPIDYDGRANHKLEVLGLTAQDRSELVSGVTMLSAPGADIVGRTINIAGVPSKSFSNVPSSSLGGGGAGIKKTTDRLVLAVRVVSNDGANPLSLSQLEDNVFSDAVNMAERYDSCSYGKMAFTPFDGTLNGNVVTQGMYEVTIRDDTDGMSADDIEEIVTDQLNIDLGSDFADSLDHIMIFVPDNIVSFGAFADFNGKFSVYDGFDASIASVTLVHEIGHNLHLDHSSEGDEEYGDDTCSMGFGLDVDDFSVCFNPPKSWTLGWYADKHLTLNLAPGDVEDLNLVGVAEYESAGSNNVIAKLVNDSGDDYFIGFNRAVGINADQIEAKDQVTVTKSAGSTELSYLEAKLSEGDTFTIQGFSSMDIEIEVTSIDTGSSPAVAGITISAVEGGPGSPFCFSDLNLVAVRGKGEIPMGKLEIGDYVRVRHGFSRVWGFLHLQHEMEADFLQITYQSADTTGQLEITKAHLIFSNGKPVAAGDVKVGDVLDGIVGNDLLVTEIQSVKRRGVYAPATESGDIIVGGVRASNYVNLLSASSVNHHAMSHGMLAPIRALCRIDFDWCRTETYTRQGYSHWVKFFIFASSVLNRFGFAIQYIATLFLAPVVATLSTMDLCSQEVVTALVGAVVGLKIYREIRCQTLVSN